MQKLKVGDTVEVMTGKERSMATPAAKRGKILAIDREAERVQVEGLRIVKRHIPRTPSTEGRILEKPGTIALSNVAFVCSKCDKPVRVGIRLEGDKKKRFCKKCNATID